MIAVGISNNLAVPKRPLLNLTASSFAPPSEMKQSHKDRQVATARARDPRFSVADVSRAFQTATANADGRPMNQTQ